MDIVEFLNLLERRAMGDAVRDEDLLRRYANYRAILNNQAEEKRIDKAFEAQTGIPIYKTMKAIEKSSR